MHTLYQVEPRELSEDDAFRLEDAQLAQVGQSNFSADPSFKNENRKHDQAPHQLASLNPNRSRSEFYLSKMTSSDKTHYRVVQRGGVKMPLSAMEQTQQVGASLR